MTDMDTEVVEKYLKKFPTLVDIIVAGTLSVKMLREILDVDRWYMNTMYKDLLVAGAIKACGPSAFRATPALREYIKSRKECIVNG